ncbi:MAG: UvrD-helicase domain-containing protein [Deltaproteobacteria bacterium]|nr:UvrD-helicase domain-containing protein [Deltaproteobacteria bacterium]
MGSRTVRPRTPPDQAAREAAVRERERNVLMDAGAGTGKTTTLVARVLHLVAPDDDGPCWPLTRIAAITFTRKAAGELRLRIRERLLATLAQAGLSGVRRERLHRAVGEMDAAWVGTIHSFADRLLRGFPVETGLSPSYDVVEDETSLLSEAVDLVLEGAQTGTLHDTFGGDAALAVLALETEATLAAAIRAGIPAAEREHAFGVRSGPHVAASVPVQPGRAACVAGHGAVRRGVVPCRRTGACGPVRGDRGGLARRGVAEGHREGGRRDPGR